ncbi:pentatricopeptide repeat-containing protein [Tanacetum coccineum]
MLLGKASNVVVEAGCLGKLKQLVLFSLSAIAMLYSQAGMVDNALKVFDEMLERKPWDFKEQSICGVVSVLLGNGFLVRGWIGCLRSMWRRRG